MDNKAQKKSILEPKTSYIVKVKRFWFFWSTYKVTTHFIRASTCAYDSDLESLELPINPWLVLFCTNGDIVVIPKIENLELKIIGKVEKTNGTTEQDKIIQ